MKTAPSDRQTAYARNLGITLDSSMSSREVSDLISIKENNDKPCTERHLKFAEFYNVPYTQYIGKKALFSAIAYELSSPGREADRASWFVFRVYRCLVKGAQNVSIELPSNPIIQSISNKLLSTSSFVASLKRYSKDETFLWFGDYTASNGSVYQGASKNTNSYKLVLQELKQNVVVLRDIESVAIRPDISDNRVLEVKNNEWTLETAPFLIKVWYIFLGSIAMIFIKPYQWTREFLRNK